MAGEAAAVPPPLPLPLPRAPHVLIFPYPAQGHVNSMLKFAELLSLTAPDIHITFVNSHHNHRLLLRHATTAARFARYRNFCFETFDDGLPEEHPRAGESAFDIIKSACAVAPDELRRLIISSRESGSGLNAPPPITCVIADGTLGRGIDVAKEAGVPLISFRTISASNVWIYFCLPQMIEAGEFPFGEEDMDQLITCIPGMEGFIRRRDLPSFFRVDDVADPVLQLLMAQTLGITEAHAVIVNTFEALEASVLAHLRSLCPPIYTIGPLPAHLKATLASHETASHSLSNSLWEEDKGCITWLDSQPSNSVVYVSFGSITVLTKEDLMEFWHGLLNSGCRFLWVIRPGSVAGHGGDRNIPVEVAEGTREGGRIVEWAPQEEVLAHWAVGVFLTHSGWNSTMESMTAGKPMICWAYFADQQMNSRFVSDVWRVGLDMKDTCGRETVEKLVRDVMFERRDEWAKSAAEMARSVQTSVDVNGSSRTSLTRLIEDIRGMCE